MTLDEAIKHAEEVAEAKERSAKLYQRPDRGVKGSGKRYLSCLECAKEHRQFAEWLKELKQLKEQEPCDDCISRQEVLDLFAQKCDAVRPYHEVWQGVKELPPVTPQPKIGKLIKYNVHGHNAHKCSKCNEDLGYPYVGRFCKNCGAKMEEVDR